MLFGFDFEKGEASRGKERKGKMTRDRGKGEGKL